MSEKRVIAVYDVTLDKATPPVVVPKGTVCAVEDVVENWVILRMADGSSCMADVPTFEIGFAAYA